MNKLAFTISSLADPELERNGYNAAFGEIGLEWLWDAETVDALAAVRKPERRIGVYIQSTHPQLLRACPVDFLANVMEGARARVIHSQMAH